MKKIFIPIIVIAVLCVGAVFLLNNVGDDVDLNNNSNNSSEKKGTPNKENKLKLSYKGANLVLGENFDSSDIDDEPKVSKIPSCAFAGEDDVYTYDNVEITANKASNSDKEILYSIYFIDDSIKTDEGLALADGIEKMESLYGKNYKKEDDRRYIYKYDNANLEITVENDVVTEIEYILVVE